MIFILKIQCFFLVQFVHIHSRSVTQFQFAKNYLSKYGYLETSEEDIPFHIALKNFQVETGLLQNGLSQKTLDLMSYPRCGVPSESGRMKRSKRFVPRRRHWLKSTLSWKLTDPYGQMSRGDEFTMRNILHRAFHLWSEATSYHLQFYEAVDVDTDFNVYFANYEHNDSLPFDGRNGVVAHGFYPFNGNLHFDADEQWTLDSNFGVDLFQTTVHEIGHLLGLEHSQDSTAVMYPINRPYNKEFHLQDDDISGIRFLYTPWTKSNVGKFRK